MKTYQSFFSIAILASLITLTAHAEAPVAPSFDLEKKIAYQQGQFGALYAHCGSPDEQVVIGGSLVSWRRETFRGYNGTTTERAGLEKAFDEAATAVMADTESCQDWVKQAAATWRSVVYLSRYGGSVERHQ